MAPRVATGTPEPNGGGGGKIDNTVEITPTSNGQVGTLGDAVPTEQLQASQCQRRQRRQRCPSSQRRQPCRHQYRPLVQRLRPAGLQPLPQGLGL
ncbi:solute carrier family 22 member 17 [Homo sapiens]|uniref:Solute carrier family 22 member 17 n=1 Tax=Homo sapiens TaxID=9606 RepID=A0A1B0GVR9_HUMAN|nr:solute carrier family 22 member 17 [Homo sapiens]KAI4060132.1 solute carrier family 22 member 17 [Homo sapiens]